MCFLRCLSRRLLAAVHNFNFHDGRARRAIDILPLVQTDRHVRPDFLQFYPRERRIDNPFLLVRQSSQDSSPGVDDKRVAVGSAARVVLAGLSGCEHVALVLDGPRSQQDLPVRSPGGGSESRRYEDNVHSCKWFHIMKGNNLQLGTFWIWM